MSDAPPDETSETLKTEHYEAIFSDVVTLLERSRYLAARTVNSLMAATYWALGRRIVEHEQDGSERAEYGKAVIERLSKDLTAQFGRGFGRRNLFQIRAFYLGYRSLDGKVHIGSALSEDALVALAARLPLSWSQYVALLSVDNLQARAFYEDEALRGGWNIKQLKRQIGSQFYERTLLSRNKAKLLQQGLEAKPADHMPPDAVIKDPYLLEFLNLRDEYSESDLEQALIEHLETFLLELGDYFSFIGRQRRLRIGDEWYRVDLLFFHRQLRCLVIIDLKLGHFTHADAGQMHLYLNYAREHWTLPEENPPVGLILCAKRDEAVAHYALGGLPNKIIAAEYRTALPDEALLVEELKRSKRELEERGHIPAIQRGSLREE